MAPVVLATAINEGNNSNRACAVKDPLTSWVEVGNPFITSFNTWLHKNLKKKKKQENVKIEFHLYMYWFYEDKWKQEAKNMIDTIIFSINLCDKELEYMSFNDSATGSANTRWILNKVS